jgi:peroxiredoxin Q/BCP
MADLEIGDIAPDFSLPTDQGEIRLADLKGRKVVVYFYPKDDTSGCTAEALDFTAQLSEFEKAGAVVIGVSKDAPKKHAKFRVKYDLAHTLGSDETGAMLQAYGSWVEKSMYGRKYMGIQRDTFLIGPDGKIAKVWRKVKVTGHAPEVLTAVKALS